METVLDTVFRTVCGLLCALVEGCSGWVDQGSRLLIRPTPQRDRLLGILPGSFSRS